MTTKEQPLYASTQTPSWPSAIGGLASGSAVISSPIDNTSNLYRSLWHQAKIKTGGSGVTANGYLAFYLASSVDGTNWDALGYTGTAGAYTIRGNEPWICNRLVPAVSTTYFLDFLLEKEMNLITLPPLSAIIVVNQSGGALDATAGNHSLTIRGVNPNFV